MSYHNTTNIDVTSDLVKKVSSQEDYIYNQFLGKDHGWTSDELYHFINTKKIVEWERQLRRLILLIKNSAKPLSLLTSMVAITDKEFDMRNSRKTNIKRCLSDLVDQGRIYRSEEKRKATTGKMCFVYKLSNR